MEHEFYPHPGVEVPVYINGKRRGNLLKLVFELDCDYPLNHKILQPDLINRPVKITTRKGAEHLIEPERLGRYQDEHFRLKYVKFTKENWEKEIFYKWKWQSEEARFEDHLDVCRKL